MVRKWFSIVGIVSIFLNEGTAFTMSVCTMKATSPCECCSAREHADCVPGGVQITQPIDCCSRRLVAIGCQTEFLQEDRAYASELQPMILIAEVPPVVKLDGKSRSGADPYVNVSPPFRQDLPVFNSSLLI